MDLTHLNDMQKMAVEHSEGALLILAGAGSGKTGVLTNRVAYLIKERAVSPYSILAITFTNKAAKEMQQRVKSLIGEDANKVWISTFHAFCTRVLRRDGQKLGYENGWSIYDTSDKTILLNQCIKELAVNKDYYKTSTVGGYISDAKNQLLDSDDYYKKYVGQFRYETISQIYELYQKKLKENNAMDFDDLIFNTIKLFQDDKEVLDYYQNRFKYCMVDEYQDTNYTQYLLVKMLCEKHGNLCVVGDDDQSIYTWRGADIRNILEFEKDFKDVKTIKLEQNYRSTSNIISAANCVIQNNKGRKDKSLWTQAQTGEKITVYRANSESDEARFVVERMEEYKDKGYKNTDFAILYRMNALSRKFEENLVKNKISYKVFGGFKFFDRAEIKDILAYLRVIENPYDKVSLKRIINVPKRGIGIKTVEKIEKLSEENNLSMMEIISTCEDYDFSPSICNKLTKFGAIMSSLKSFAKAMDVGDLLEKVLESTGYVKELQSEKTIESASRIENINELFSVVKEFETTNEDKSLSNFLQTASLSTDMDEDAGDDYVSLMTVHSAKGLEFPVVFIVGLEDGIFPSSRSMDSDEQLEEERRLCYVAITRAKEKLFISHCYQRMLYGRTQKYVQSRFLEEISKQYLDKEQSRLFNQGQTRVEKKTDNYSLHQKYVEKYKLFNKMQKESDLDPQNLKVGTRVKHKSFGEGMIVSKNGDQYSIAFDGKGVKKIDTKYVSLEIIK